MLRHASAAEVHTRAGGRFSDEKTCMSFDVRLQRLPEPSIEVIRAGPGVSGRWHGPNDRTRCAVKHRDGMPWQGNRSIIPSGRNHRRARLKPVLLVLEDRRLLATFTVTNALDTLVGNNVNDPTTGTLRWAVEQVDQAGGDNAINFDPTVFDAPQTIALTAGELELSDIGGFTAILGPTAGLNISGSGLSRVFQLDDGVGAMISDLTISDGSSTDGGGIYSKGYLTINNCTISGNYSSDFGGGIYTGTGADLDVTNCTFISNSSFNSGVPSWPTAPRS